MFVKRFLLIEHNLNADRQNIKVLLHLIAQSLNGFQTHSVLLCGDDTLGRGKPAECLIDETDILLLEVVVISKDQRVDDFGIRLEVELHLLW